MKGGSNAKSEAAAADEAVIVGLRKQCGRRSPSAS